MIVCEVSVAFGQPELGKPYPSASLPYQQQCQDSPSPAGSWVTMIWSFMQVEISRAFGY